MARLVLVHNQFAPSFGMQEFHVPAGTSVAAALAMSGWKLPPRTVLLKPNAPHYDLRRPDECLIHPDALHAVAVNDNMPAVYVRIAGNNKNASQIAGVLASLALAFFAPVIGGVALDALGISSTAAVLGVSAARIAAGVILVGGNAIISHFLPAPKPFSAPADTSPTYSVSAQSNQARLGAKEPELFGRHMIMCDLIAAPYVDYVDNKQRVSELLCVTKGDANVETIRAGQAVLWQYGVPTGAYPEIEIEVIPPGGTVGLVHDNVFTSSEVNGQTILGPNEKDYGPVGPFIASKPGQYTNRFEIDLNVALFKTDTDGHVQAQSLTYELEGRPVDNTGTPKGAGTWTTVIDPGDVGQLSFARRTPQRITVGFTTATADRWQFRMTRVSDKSTDSNVTDVLQWIGLKAYLPAPAQYSRLTCIALRATGTVNVNGDALNKINVIAQRKLSEWDAESGTWTDPVPTSQIAAAARHICEEKLGRAANRIDLAALQSLQETWTARGDEHNAVYDSAESAWEALQGVLRCGRTKPIPGTKIGFVRDEARTVPSVPFGPGSMVPDSLNIGFNLDTDTIPDGMVVEFVDRRTWSTNRVLCALPGSAVTIDDEAVQIKGITDRDHVWREGIFTIADGYYRRVSPSFRTLTEGRLAVAGSLVSVSHWLMDWGADARVIGLTEGAAVDLGDGDVYQDLLLLNQPWSRPEDAAEDDANLIQLKAPDGNSYGPVPFELIDDGEETGRAIVKLLDKTPLSGGYADLQPRAWGDWSEGEMRLVRLAGTGDEYRANCEPLRAHLGTGEKVPQNCILQSMKPDAKSQQADVQCVVDDARVHAVDTGDPPAEVGGPESALGADLVITGLTIAESVAAGKKRATFTAAGAGDADTFDFNWKPATQLMYEQASLETGHARTFSHDWDVATTVSVIVRGRGAAGIGIWYETTFRADGTADTVPADVGTVSGVFETDHSGTTYDWSAVTGAVGYHILKMARVHGSDSFTQAGAIETVYAPEFVYYASDEVDDGGPFNNFYIRVKAFNAAGESPDWTDADHGT